MLSELGKPEYLEVGDDSRLKADVIMISGSLMVEFILYIQPDVPDTGESRGRGIPNAGECRTPELPTAKQQVIIVIVPNGTKRPPVTSPESGEEDGTAEPASYETVQRLHRALSAAADSSTTIVVAANTLAPSTVDATRNKGASTLVISVQSNY